MVGESTIARLVNDAAKFPDFCPETRILLLLRDPVDRCVSQFRMRQRLQMKKVHKGSVTGSVRKDLRIFEKGKFSRPKMTADDVLEMKQGYFPKWRSVRYRALFELTKLISFFFLRQRLCLCVLPNPKYSFSSFTQFASSCYATGTTEHSQGTVCTKVHMPSISAGCWMAGFRKARFGYIGLKIFLAIRGQFLKMLSGF